MQLVAFSPEEKIKCFETLSERYFSRNFGKASKSEIELLLFHFYIEKLIKTIENPDGTIDYRKCSDYRIACDLGLTPQQVRNLKVKSHMMFPIQFDWQKSLAPLLEFGKLNADGSVSVPIPDPVLYLAIQNYLEEHNTFSTESLTTKCLTLAPEDYLDLALQTEDNAVRKKCEALLAKKKLDGIACWDPNHKVRSLIKAGVSIAEIVADIIQCTTPASMIARVASGLNNLL